MKLFDPVRRRLVAATPEERVRQGLLLTMIQTLGYPKGLLAVEKEVGNTRRRADIVCYSSKMAPLLLIECKAEGDGGAQEQAMGYNAFLEAPFFSIASKSEVATYWFDGVKIASVPFLPRFDDLLRQSMR